MSDHKRPLDEAAWGGEGLDAGEDGDESAEAGGDIETSRAIAYKTVFQRPSDTPRPAPAPRADGSLTASQGIKFRRVSQKAEGDYGIAPVRPEVKTPAPGTFAPSGVEGNVETADGVITVVQEGRFKLVTDEGRVMHFMLAHDAALEPGDLPALARAQTRLRVGYTRPDHLIAAVAHDLRTLEQEALEAAG